MNYNLLFNRLAIALAFIIPISIAGYNLILAALTLTWILEAKWKEKWEMIKIQPVFKAMLIYFLFTVLSLLWTENLSSGLYYVKQYYIFFLLPILYTSIDRSHIPKFLSAFLLAMIISEIISYLIYFDVMPFKLNPSWSPSDPSPFMMHTIYSIFLVFSIFLMLTRLSYEKRTQSKAVIYIFFIISMTLNLFLNSGRTGQFSLLLAMMVFIYIRYNFHWIKTITIAIAVSGTVFITAFFISHTFQQRSIETYNSLCYTLENKQALNNDSTGLRFMMWQVASNIILEHPIIGVGVGDERDSYAKTLSNKLPELKLYINGFSDLHNTYLKILVSTGVIGLSLFLWVFYTLYKEIETSTELHIIGGVLISLLLQYMFIGNLPAAYLTILFIFMISIVLKHPHSKCFDTFSVK
ncbi:MAG: O-antigen ligase family protein [Sulfuricurvum sp.]|jgi:O-antigen ligase